MQQPVLHTLGNGLKVVLVPCEAESVAFGIFVNSGSRHEPTKIAGISHFIEHMVFKGTPTRRPVDITRAIEGRGGNFNASTGEESTCYYAHLPSDYLADAVEILSDMYLHATFLDDEFVREKQVVIEEIKMYDDQPDNVALENLQAALFPGHPLGRPVAGSAKSLAPMTPDDLRAYVKAHYTPSRTSAVVVGAFDPERALGLVTKFLGPDAFAAPGCARRKGNACRLAPVRPETRASKSDISQVQLALGYRTFGLGDGRKFAASVLDGLLGRGMSSRLFQEVREKRGLSYDIASRQHFFSDAGLFAVAAGVDAAKATRTLQTVDRELERISTRRVPTQELKLIKEYLVGNFMLAHEKVISKLFYYGQSSQLFSRLVPPAEQISAIHAVTPDEIRAVAQDVFAPENRSVSWVWPKD